MIAVDCGQLPVPMNGSQDGSRTTYPNKMLFSCDEGFIMKGSSLRRCQANRTWSGERVTCEGEIKNAKLAK